MRSAVLPCGLRGGWLSFAAMQASRAARRAGGVYYTPAPIVKYIVRHTLAPLLANGESGEAVRLTIVDPACGAGALLVEAYRELLQSRLANCQRQDIESLAAAAVVQRSTPRPTTWPL